MSELGTAAYVKARKASVELVEIAEKTGVSLGTPISIAAALEAKLAADGMVTLDTSETLDRALVMPNGTRIEARTKGLAGLKLATSATSRAVIRPGNNCLIDGLLLDGNLVARETAGTIVDYCWGVQITNKSGTIVRNVTYADAGCTESDFTANGGNGGGVLIEVDATTATSDVTGNRVLDCGGDIPKAGFHARIYTRFNNGASGIGHGSDTYYATGNEIARLNGSRSRKNGIEIVGPNTRRNVIRSVKLTNLTGQGGIEADFGAHFNDFIECHLFFDSAYILGRSFDGFNQNRSESSKGARSFGNKFVDCQLEFLGQLSGAFNLSGFTEKGASSYCSFIRPKMYCGYTGGSTSGQFRKAGGATGIVSGYLNQLQYGSGVGSYLEAPDFQNIDRGIKFVGSQAIDFFKVNGGHIFSRGACVEFAHTNTITKFLATGDLYLQSVGGALEVGSGTVTTKTYDSSVRTQTSATSPIT